MRALVFGASGSIGSHIIRKLNEDGINTIGTSTQENEHVYVANNNMENLSVIDNVDIVIWAHGYNFNDNINTFNLDEFNKMVECNITFIPNTLNFLLKHNKINDNAKMVIISSIWEDLTRDNKLSYSITKSALGGMVKNLAFDLSSKNILDPPINGSVLSNSILFLSTI